MLATNVGNRCLTRGLKIITIADSNRDVHGVQGTPNRVYECRVVFADETMKRCRSSSKADPFVEVSIGSLAGSYLQFIKDKHASTSP